MSRFKLCDCPAGFSAAPERHAPDCPGRSGAGKPASIAPRNTHADPAEVERLRDKFKCDYQDFKREREKWWTERDTLRAQLAECRKALQLVDRTPQDSFYRDGVNVAVAKALSASAEPSAPVEIDNDALVAAVCVLRSQGLGNLSAAVEEARAALERK